MNSQERKEYLKKWYQAHKEHHKAKMKAYYQAHKEHRKAYRQAHKEQRNAYYQAHKDQCKARTKEYYQAHKEQRNAYYQAHKEQHKAKMNAYAKEYYQAHKEEIKSKMKAYEQAHKEKKYARLKSDVNLLGQTKHSVRLKSNKILKKMNLHIPGYQIHHCFGYEDASKFIYISKSLHLKIHQYLRDNNIDASSDHWMDIRDMVNSTYEYMYIKR